MSKFFWEILIALTFIFSPAARAFVRSAATTCWNTSKGVVAAIWPPTRAIFRWTIRIGIVAVILIIAGIWFPSLHILAAIVLAVWFFLWMEALSGIASIVNGISITIPGTGTSITLSGAPIAAALRSAGKPLGLFLMFLGCWILQIVVFPGLMAFAGLIILASIFFWFGYAARTGGPMKWLNRILIFFFWLSVLGFAIQGISKYTPIGAALEENRKENFQWVVNQIEKITVTTHKKNRADRAQTEFERLESYPFRSTLWTSNPNRKGMEIPLFDANGNPVADPDAIVKVLHGFGSWHPTEEKLPKKVSSLIAAPMVVVEASDDRTIKYIVPAECLLGYMAKSPKTDLEAAKIQTQRAIEKKSIYNEVSKPPVIEKINRIRVVASSIAPFWWMDQNGQFQKVSIQTGTVAKVLARIIDLPNQPISIPEETPPAGVPDDPALKIEILQGANIGDTGWLPAEFVEWIINPLLPANPGGGGTGGQMGNRLTGQTLTVTTPDGKKVAVTRGTWANTGYLIDLGKDEESTNFILSENGLVAASVGGSVGGGKQQTIGNGGTFTITNSLKSRLRGAVWVKVE